MRFPGSDEACEHDPVTCPACGCENLDQDKIMVWRRYGDPDGAGGSDGDEVRLSAAQAGTSAVTISRKSGEFYGQRQSLCIEFHCDLCEFRPVLRIYQHEGYTHIEWAYA